MTDNSVSFSDGSKLLDDSYSGSVNTGPSEKDDDLKNIDFSKLKITGKNGKPLVCKGVMLENNEWFKDAYVAQDCTLGTCTIASKKTKSAACMITDDCGHGKESDKNSTFVTIDEWDEKAQKYIEKVLKIDDETIHYRAPDGLREVLAGSSMVEFIDMKFGDATINGKFLVWKNVRNTAGHADDLGFVACFNEKSTISFGKNENGKDMTPSSIIFKNQTFMRYLVMMSKKFVQDH